ncbi:MAG: acyl-CoA dehydratase activase [Erysipelotrichaceae bacterium]|nr:acyl-CoA dehydratase activase [Erysipelotrichaceae bacterium]
MVNFNIGIDIGSTTAKLLVLKDSEIIYKSYERHFSQVKEKTLELLEKVKEIVGEGKITLAISGSAGMGLAQSSNIEFVQEVYATSKTVKLWQPDTSAVIELGGEDAKIIFFDNGIDERMNSSCAGGTGAFIDQMATLLNVSTDELDSLSLKHEKTYPIASRCGVFAKSDIQPLLNQGARKEDIAYSIYQAVVNQTIAGLAQGRKIAGKVLFLGGPLYYLQGLKQCFKETLKLSNEEAIFPEDGRFSVAMGAALYGAENSSPSDIDTIIRNVSNSKKVLSTEKLLDPLFIDESDYEEFRKRHKKDYVGQRNINTYSGKAYLGIDCGSTTTKIVLLSQNKEILYSFYNSNCGNPLSVLKKVLIELYEAMGNRITIAGSACTGYGEELIKEAFGVDEGLVETMAHFKAAKHFLPEVDYIMDIGGQDMKCFAINNGVIESIILNEACSSGCGSFIETFAKAMGIDIDTFGKMGLYAKHPVNLGSRCTVFMNSSVKQAQKDGATVEDISAGLSYSIVMNAIYKVLRVHSAEELGKNIVVQGGTFLNDAILRAFEKEINGNVVRPNIAGLMGAYGAALEAMKYEKSSLLSLEELKKFACHSVSSNCKGCGNNCHLTINTFSSGKRYITGNQCNKALGLSGDNDASNIYEFKQKLISSYKPQTGKRGKLGLPMQLSNMELYPLWYTLFTHLGFEVIMTPLSSRKTFEKGQFTIPSDTVCYPAKLMHGHIQTLIDEKIPYIFYPCLTYNFKEKGTDNNYNCPIVAYYGELLHANIEDMGESKLLYPYLNINNRKELGKELYSYLKPYIPDLKRKELFEAIKEGMKAYSQYQKLIKQEGKRLIDYARNNNKKIMVLSGRPYHIDKEIEHGISKLANSLGFVIVSEDSIYHLAKNKKVKVLNQWTYHSRLYKAAYFARENEDVQLVQLVSFGCGMDAITSDEVKAILEEEGKIYTQLKIDEIANLGTVKIRLRSLLGALENRGE